MIKQVLPKVFWWMCFGLLLTFATGYILSLYPYALFNILNSFGGFGTLILLLIELGLVIFLSARVTKMRPITAKISFLIYSFVSGITFGTIFLIYEMTSIMFIFLITSAIFAIFALFGSVTKIDLSKIGVYLLMALIAAIICLIVNIFIGSSTFDLIISIIIVIIFVIFTAYDVQQIKYLSSSNVIEEDNLAIYGALTLYLDYINLFIHLLNIFGKKE